ncbi:5-(carboxyamino)imidazole ribonucleotide synthase [Nesterenkonia natronophila]|uniref:N5-carboxyaminoimidazole ribonucleotide synthase n=1 Tax=Nesterenkonia natronophila TaxID=2174932 RepID=A0A3A4FIB1_9MICC|nr:5-(carboxyamino)imidazole ribonucleotide synthase [Nesterenkonia natronophila]RJN32065.1 5-(carboxyamino)imidazole ribonucleotide synthase [Nesterenkonia natronophila]
MNTSVPKIGVLGDGQLARMMAPAATQLGVELHLLAGSAEASAAQVISKTTIGDFRIAKDVLEFAEGLDAITFDHEHVPEGVLTALVESGATLNPSPEALIYAQDKLAMRRAMDELGLPNPRWTEVHTTEDLASFGSAVGWPVVLKTPRGGYDGKGVMVLDDPSSVHAPAVISWFDRAAEERTGLLAEQKMPFTRELSAQVARRASGAAAAYPVVASTQTHGVCDEVVAPAPRTSPNHLAEAERIATTIAERLGVTGMLAVELFEIAEDDGAAGTPPGIYVNELAMRPHNSGHWTIDGSVTSQFEQHLRAVLDLPLGATSVTGGAGGYVVMKNLLGGANQDLHSALPAAMRRSGASKIHLYGKEPTPGRKIGHVTMLTQTTRRDETYEARRTRLARVRQSVAEVAHILTEGEAQA